MVQKLIYRVRVQAARKEKQNVPGPGAGADDGNGFVVVKGSFSRAEVIVRLFAFFVNFPSLSVGHLSI